VYRTAKTVWGRERTVVLYVSETLRSGQQRGLDQHLARAQKTLNDWKERLGKPRSGVRSAVMIDRRIERILAPQFLKRVLRVSYDADKKGSERLQWSVDQVAYDGLCRDYFGKRILISNRDQWSSEEIIRTYRGQSQIENAFRQSKDDEHFAMRPQFHWTDQKIHVHAFICLLALMMGRLIERTARTLGRKESLSTLMDELQTIRLAMVLTKSGTKAGRPRAEWMLEKTEPKALQLFQALVPHAPPFVYTQSSAASPSEITA
jgi:transposase